MKKLIISGVAMSAVISTVSLSYVFAEGKHAGGHGQDAGSGQGGAHWASPKKAAARVNPIKSDQASLDRGKQVFMTNCTSCHGATAKGDGPVGANLNPKPTDLTIMAGNHPDGDFEWKIANGRGAMPAWKSSLNQTQRWDVVNYIQTLENPNGKGNMAGMDHSKMNKASMADMDHSNMSEADMKAMMGQSSSLHSNEDDHHKTNKTDGHNDKKNSHSD
ncbi:c-type cytochrome [uncultured Cocleimonas sp.]|uniref:c-type cytochrome n=1 Tax=uncultured Cocleimonas sp. TaxID=1051587 RepID=UPI00260160ED|nr:c-type cytochrome [uncultured Cocleimonas sp.]